MTRKIIQVGVLAVAMLILSGVTGGGSFYGVAKAFGYGGGGGHGTPHNPGQTTQGQVLGAEACTPLLTDYMKEGMTNNPDQVKALQTFLNTEMNSGLPVTGFFGPLTTAAVKAFQTKYATDVLDPWTKFGFNVTATGYVYKLTEWKINSIHCAPTTVAMPTLP